MKNTAPDLSGFVNVHGAAIVPMGPSFTAPKRSASIGSYKAVTSRDEAKESNGFRVVGYPPGMIAQAQAFAEAECATWAALASEEQARRIKDGSRAPKAWNEDEWRSRVKPKNVRSKPYEIASAAQQCAELATRAGWQHVAVVELLRG